MKHSLFLPPANTRFVLKNMESPQSIESEEQEIKHNSQEKVDTTLAQTKAKLENIIPLTQEEKEEAKKRYQYKKEDLDIDGTTEHKEVSIIESDKDRTMYAPVRWAAAISSLPYYAIKKGIIGMRRRILESTSYLNTEKTEGITTLDITSGLRDIGIHEGAETLSALESWKNENPDKRVLSFGEASGTTSKNLTITWEKQEGANTPSFERKSFHYPIVKTNKSNAWAPWRYISWGVNALSFGFNRIVGRNKTATSSRAMVLDEKSGLKQVSLQVTPSLSDYTLKNDAFLINQSIINWKKMNPNAHITRVATSNTGSLNHSDESVAMSPGKLGISILYTEKTT